jgi:molecular chaperone DnaK
VKIEASTALSKEEIEKLKKEAAEHASEDIAKKDLAETRNQAESTVYLAEKSLKDAGDKISAEVKSAVEAKLQAVKGVKDTDNLEAIKSALADLSAEIQKIGQAMYNKEQDGRNTDPGTPGPRAAEPDTESH